MATERPRREPQPALERHTRAAQRPAAAAATGRGPAEAPVVEVAR